MTRKIRRAMLGLACAALAALTVTAAPAPPVVTTGTVKDRESFIPYRKYAPMPGKVVALLASDVLPKMMHEGRSSAAENMGLSFDGNSYRWIYVPVPANPQIGNLQMRIGEKGDRIQVFPSLSMGNLRTLAQWDIKVPYALVEVEVNGGAGAPADEAFVATKMTRLDGTKDFPINVADVVAEVRKRYATWQKEQKEKLDDALMEAQKKAIKDRKPTGPRETNELVYMTWLPEARKFRFNFRTTLTDGEYKFAGGGPFDRDPIPLPPPPLPPGKPVPPGALPPALPPAAAAPPRAAFPPPPPPFRPRVRYGTSFGIEYGMSYEVTTSGKVDRILTLPAQSFVKELPIPPGIGPIRGPIDPLPPKPLPIKK
jgi:hypothetical protein